MPTFDLVLKNFVTVAVCAVIPAVITLLVKRRHTKKISA